MRDGICCYGEACMYCVSDSSKGCIECSTGFFEYNGECFRLHYMIWETVGVAVVTLAIALIYKFKTALPLSIKKSV